MKPKRWDFPMDWIKKKQDELFKVRDVLKKIEPDKNSD